MQRLSLDTRLVLPHFPTDLIPSATIPYLRTLPIEVGGSLPNLPFLLDEQRLRWLCCIERAIGAAQIPYLLWYTARDYSVSA